MPEEIQSQAPDPPAEPVVAEQPVAQAIDYAALETQAQSDYGMSLSDVSKGYGASRSKMTETNQEFADYKKQYAWAPDFDQALQNNPGLEDHIRAWDGFSEQPQAVQTQVNTAINPDSRRLQNMETVIHSMQMDKQLKGLEDKYGMPDGVRDRVLDESIRTNSGDMEAIYWKMRGPDMLKGAQLSGAQQTATQIKEQNSVIVPGSGPATNTGAAPDVASMDAATYDRSLDDAIADAYNKGG